jgi:hypothetical protein
MPRLSPSEARGWMNTYVRFEQETIRFWDQSQREVEATRVALAPARENLPTQHAYAMLCFGQIDGLSQHWRGGKAWDRRHNGKKNRRFSAQTQRMVSFMYRYMHVKPAPGRIAVEMYRHTLMHEGRVRPILDVHDRLFAWYLAWEAAPAHHLHIRQPETMGDTYLVECAVVNLIVGVGQAIRAYADDLKRDPVLQRNFRYLYDQRLETLLD